MSAQTRGPISSASGTVNDSADTILTENIGRNFLFIQNLDDTDLLGITLDGTTPVIGAAGTITLTPYNSLEYNTYIPTGPVNIISSNAGGSIYTCLYF